MTPKQHDYRHIAAALVLAPLFLSIVASAQAATPQEIRRVVSMLANSLVRDGEVVGAAVGIVYPGQPFLHYEFGYADAASATPFAANSIFAIGSNTKVFTTNLLGQAISKKSLLLTDPLSKFSVQLGQLKPLTSQVTLKDVGSFTAGFPDYAPSCHTQTPGCLEKSRPPISEYTVSDFLKFFRHTVPRNYTVTPKHAPALTSLPGPYFYSDYSIGLLGLLVATPTDAPIGGNAVNIWYNHVNSQILAPLGMDNTYLEVPKSVPVARIANGYSPAHVAAVLSDGTISTINIIEGGDLYNPTPGPTVTIVGGGGTGAKAKATVSGGQVSAIEVSPHGSGYIAPPEFIFSGNKVTKPSKAEAIVAGGKIVAANVTFGGDGYTRAPKVTIEGGNRAGGVNAKAVAHIANGRVTSLTITDGGTRYVPPLAIVVSPGAPRHNVIPVWAPAGALSSTVTDMTKFAAGALGKTVVRGRPVPPALTAGFAAAEAEYACTEGKPALDTCPSATNKSGLAWEILPADKASGVPEIITKNGGLPGFSSQILLIPNSQIAVVVLINSFDGKSTAEPPAQNLAFQIAYGLLYGKP